METNNEHFLKWITVEEFKCFFNFHAEGFKRVNLIGGRNNVGKTALMEAMFIKTNNNYTNFINTYGFKDTTLAKIYQSVQILDKEVIINDYINEFDADIKSFKIIDGKPQCKSNGVYREITEFGDGLRTYISIICAFYACQNGYLFIDELDNGIYYEHFDRLWEIILTLSKEMNCQVFATTHSKEMLESFARVAKKLEEQDVSYTLLLKNKKQELKTISFDYEMLEYSMTQEHEVR